MFQGKKVVFFAAHTDDEMICAGTLHRMVREGAEVHVVAFAHAATISDRRGMVQVSQVLEEWNESMRLLGVYSRKFHRLIPSSDFQPHRQLICQWMYDFCEGEKPDIVITLSPEDENTAHRIVGEECERVTRGRVPFHLRCQFPWNICVGSPNLYVKLEDEDVEVKRKVIQAYKSQHFRYQYEDLLMSLARVDGLSVKVPWAEKFQLIRGVL